MFNKMTIADSITRFMIRRGRGDTLLCLFLGLLTLVIMYYCYYYIKPAMKLGRNWIKIGKVKTT